MSARSKWGPQTSAPVALLLVGVFPVGQKATGYLADVPVEGLTPPTALMLGPDPRRACPSCPQILWYRYLCSEQGGVKGHILCCVTFKVVSRPS